MGWPGFFRLWRQKNACERWGKTGVGVRTIPQLQWDQQKSIGPMGSCSYDVPWPEGGWRRLTVVVVPGLVAVFRIVPPRRQGCSRGDGAEGAVRQLDPPRCLW